MGRKDKCNCKESYTDTNGDEWFCTRPGVHVREHGADTGPGTPEEFVWSSGKARRAFRRRGGEPTDPNRRSANKGEVS